MNNSLCCEDFDDVDIIEEVERRFEVTFSEDELENLVTVGGLHDLIVTKLGDVYDPDAVCHTLAAYLRLRRFVPRGVTLDARGADTFGAAPVAEAMRISAACGAPQFNPAPTRWGKAVMFGARMMVLSCMMAVFAMMAETSAVFGLMAVAFAGAAWLLLAIDNLFKEFFRQAPSLREVIESVAQENYVIQRASRGLRCSGDVWTGLLGAIHERIEAPRIDRETTFYA